MSSLKYVSIIYAALLLSANVVLSQDTADRGHASGQLKLTIRSEKPSYDLKDARVGNLVIRAQIQNSSDHNILLAHPNICFPYELSDGQSFKPDQTQSHLSVLIESPQGMTTILRNNILRMFEPGSRHYLMVMPGGSKEFILGWFGPEYGLGQWKIDRAVFNKSGRYRITVQYKNTYPVAYIFDENGKQSPAEAWTGEFQSNTVSLEVK